MDLITTINNNAGVIALIGVIISTVLVFFFRYLDRPHIKFEISLTDRGFFELVINNRTKFPIEVKEIGLFVDSEHMHTKHQIQNTNVPFEIMQRYKNNELNCFDLYSKLKDRGFVGKTSIQGYFIGRGGELYKSNVLICIIQK